MFSGCVVAVSELPGLSFVVGFPGGSIAIEAVAPPSNYDILDLGFRGSNGRQIYQ